MHSTKLKNALKVLTARYNFQNLNLENLESILISTKTINKSFKFNTNSENSPPPKYVISYNKRILKCSELHHQNSTHNTVNSLI